MSAGARAARPAELHAPGLAEIAAFLDAYLRVEDYPEEHNGVLRATGAAVCALGIALDPAPGLAAWVGERDLDALLLHRHWGLDLERLARRVGVLAYHLPFDERLTPGYSPLLAEALRLAEPEPLGARRGRPLGMIGRAGVQDFAALRALVQLEFGGLEAVIPPARERVERVAVVGAMTDALVREAAARGAALYLTGQLRAPARDGVRETGIGVLATGHRRAEEWGARALARLLGRRWPALEVHVMVSSHPEATPC